MIKNVKKKLWLVGGHALASCRRPAASCRAGPPLRRAVKPPCCCAACLCLPAGGRGGSRWQARTRRGSTRRPAHALLRYDPPVRVTCTRSIICMDACFQSSIRSLSAAACALRSFWIFHRHCLKPSKALFRCKV